VGSAMNARPHQKEATNTKDETIRRKTTMCDYSHGGFLLSNLILTILL
jgi:hypothetical protein